MDKTPTIRTTLLAAGCAITLSAMLGACASTTSAASPKSGGIIGTAPNPGTTPGTSTTASTTPTPSTTTTTTAGTSTPATPDGTHSTRPGTPTPPNPASPPAPASVTGEFLSANQLPDATFYGWSRQYITEVNVEHPLQPVCGKALGTEQNTSVWDARYPATDGQSVGEEAVHTYPSASVAAARFAAASPACPGLTARTANGFAWRTADHGSGYTGITHVLYVNVGAKVAVVTITVPKRDYNASLDAKLLQAMAKDLGTS